VRDKSRVGNNQKDVASGEYINFRLEKGEVEDVFGDYGESGE